MEGTPEQHSNDHAEKMERRRVELAERIATLTRDPDAGFVFMGEEVPEYVERLTEQYGRAALERTKLFHMLIGSSYNEAQSPELDLPNGELEAFINDALQRRTEA